MNRYLNKETILGSILLATFAWALVMIVGMNSDVSALKEADKEDKRVNKVVYEMNDTLIRLEEGQKGIKEDLEYIKKKD